MKPILAPGRVVGLDVARALALVAMMATHILPGVGRDGAVTLTQQVAGGRAAALFAVLAGVTIALTSGRRTPPQGRARRAARAALVVRALLVALVGLALGQFHTGIAVILAYYGVLFGLAVPFLGLRARALALTGLAWVVVVPVLSHLLRPQLPGPSYDNPTLASLGDPLRLLGELTFTGYYPAVPWVGYLLVGMALGRSDLHRWRTAAGLVVAGGGLALTASALSAALLGFPEVRQRLVETATGPAAADPLAVSLERGLYGTTPTGSWWWLAVDAPHSTTPLDLTHTIGTSLLAIGVCLVAGRLLPRTLAVVCGAGAMTLTLYAAHVASRSRGRWDGESVSTYAGQVLAVLAVGAAFRLARRRGPLESVLARAAARVRRATAGTPRR